ncbi:MAG: hypothetical protein IPH52_17950 [Leptospiraceae bacterium]|nr:hypothetical protein [Leptospiraceae bacterium]
MVKKISAVHENKKEFLSAEKKKQASFGLEKEIVYLAKIISLSKETNTPIVIVKPFFLFKYEKFTISFWKEFYKFQHHFSDLSKIRERQPESDRMYEEFKEFAYAIDITNQILTYSSRIGFA